MSVSDQDLIRQVLTKRDQRAFSQLVLRYQSQVRTWCRRLCNGDAAQGDDLAQEVFIKAFAALSAFKQESKFSVWLYRIAFNAAVSTWRKKHIEWCDLDDVAERADEQEDAGELVNSGHIKQAISQLSEPQQIAIGLCFEEGLSHTEAASVMNIPLGSLKTHINRGKVQLKKLLADWS